MGKPLQRGEPFREYFNFELPKRETHRFVGLDDWLQPCDKRTF